MVIEGNTSDSPCGEPTLLYLECGGGYTKLHM